MKTPTYRPNLVKRRIAPESDNRGLDADYMSDSAQKAYFLAAVWLVLAINVSAIMGFLLRDGQYPMGAIIAILSVILWRRVIQNVRTAMYFKG